MLYVERQMLYVDRQMLYVDRQIESQIDNLKDRQ